MVEAKVKTAAVAEVRAEVEAVVEAVVEASVEGAVHVQAKAITRRKWQDRKRLFDPGG